MIESSTTVSSLSDFTTTFADLNSTRKSFTYEFPASNRVLIFAPLNHSDSSVNVSIDILCP